MRQSERLELLIRMLDPEDYGYIRAQDSRVEARFRRERMKVYRSALKALAWDVADIYQTRLANMNAAGYWSAYPRLLLSTASMFFSLGKLWCAGILFRYRLPVGVNLPAQEALLQRFLNVEPPSSKLPHLTA
jgi:hypothetical protein